MASISCGIDFGTSNSSVAIATGNAIKLVPVEDHHGTIPSAIFYGPSGTVPSYGRVAVKSFFERNPGRFMRSLKRVLGNPVMNHGTLINGKPVKFQMIISSFLKNLKEKTDAFAGVDVHQVVLGRPVHFVDNNTEADARAQHELAEIAQRIGYKHVEFQFEPIAAAFAHEVNFEKEKLAIVADLGGGTSDFTIIRLSKNYISKIDRSSDILANTGVRVGGNDFDKELSLSAIMPDIGYKTTYGPKNLEVPLKYFHDLSEWSKVNFLYTPKVLAQVRQFCHESHAVKKLARLLQLLEQERGHAVLSKAEEIKIALTSQSQCEAVLEFDKDNLPIPVAQKQFETAIEDAVEKISVAAVECLKKASVTAAEIDLVILTGGSTEVPLVRSKFKSLFPKAEFSEEHKLSSVGLGLAYDSQRRYR